MDLDWLIGYEILGNSLEQWGIAIIISIAMYFIFTIAKWVLINRFQALSKKIKHGSDIFSSMAYMFSGIRLWLMFFISISVGSHFLKLHPVIDQLLWRLAIIAAFIQIGIWGKRQIDFWVERSKKHAATKNISATTSLGPLKFVGTLILWAIVILLLLQNLGIDITAMIAGLGIGGIAVALAVQNVLGDLLASLAIVFDKPVEVGDFVEIPGGYSGTIEYVGLKTTRIRSISGEQLIVSNSDLLSARVRNYKRMAERRIVFTFKVTYDTTTEQIKNAQSAVKELITSKNSVRFDRVHFKGFGDSDLTFEAVYYVLSSDYTLYMDIQQEINLGLMEIINNLGMKFALPSRTIYMGNTAQTNMISSEKNSEIPNTTK